MIRSIIAAGAVAFSFATAGSAATLTYLGASTGSSGGSVYVNESPVTGAGTVNAYGFRMTDGGGPLGNFIAWCLDLTNPLRTTSTYLATATPFTQFAVPVSRIQAMFDANFGSVDTTNQVQAAAFQLALWEVLYDDDYSLTRNTYATNDFRGQGNVGGTGTSTSRSINSTAASYLAAAQNYGGSKMWNLTYLQATGTPRSQSLVTVSPVPVPAAGLLLLAALGGVAAVRRRTA